MNSREKEKYWKGLIKQIFKTKNWGYKSFFAFKIVNGFFYDVMFFIHKNSNSIDVRLEFKPYSLDNLFWEIIDEPNNKKQPLSFRRSAAFCVDPTLLLKYTINIKDVINPHSELMDLLKSIEQKVEESIRRYLDTNDFLNLILVQDNKNSSAVLTSLIELKKYKEVISKVTEYKSSKVNPRFTFSFESGVKDYHDLAKEYCEKKIMNRK